MYDAKIHKSNIMISYDSIEAITTNEWRCHGQVGDFDK